jgi:hypothetical protein
MREFSAGSEQLDALCTITPHIRNGKDHPIAPALQANALAATRHVLLALVPVLRMLLLPPADSSHRVSDRLR